MSDCQFQNLKGIKYLFTWADIGLHAEVTRVSMNHNASKALVVFTSSHKDANPHILQTRLNLESTRSRNEVAKELGMRYTVCKGVDWKGLCEYLCVKTIREYEKGDPVILITSEDECEPLRYLLHPLVPENKPTVLFGDPGSGKSQLAVVIIMAIMLPWRNNPLKLGVPAKPETALFLDYESDPDDVRRQVVSLCKGMKLPYIEVHYRRCSLPIADDIEAIRSHAEAINASCLIIDSTSLAAGNDLNRMDVSTAYFRALRQLNMTTVSLAHTSKDRESKNKTILGSVLWEAGARSVWEVKGQEDDGVLDIALFHRKSNLSQKFGVQGYRITYDQDAGGNSVPVDIRWHNPKDIAEFVERMSTNERILHLLREGRMTIETVADTLEIKPGSAKVSLYRLRKKDMVTRLPDETWGLLGR